MIFEEKWEAMLDDSRIADPRIGGEILTLHDEICEELLVHLGCTIVRRSEEPGWFEVNLPGGQTIIHVPTSGDLPEPPILGKFEECRDAMANHEGEAAAEAVAPPRLEELEDPGLEVCNPSSFLDVVPDVTIKLEDGAELKVHAGSRGATIFKVKDGAMLDFAPLADLVSVERLIDALSNAADHISVARAREEASREK